MAKNIIGLDIGGTKITGILFDPSRSASASPGARAEADGKKVLKHLTIVTPKNGFEFERNLIKLCDFLSAKEKIRSVGIGIAGLVNPKKGVVKYSANFQFKKNLDLIKLFKANGFKKVAIDNDANCFTRAEMLLGQGRKYKNFLTLTLGTGVGGGIVIDGKIYRGVNNLGAEFGHLVYNGGFLEKHFQKTRVEDDYKEMSVILGRGFAGLVNIFASQAIILGGSVSHNAGPKFVPGAKKEMRKFLFNEKAQVQILVSKLKNAGALGAALLVK